MLQSLVYEIQSLYDPARAEILQRFFQTHTGGYGEGDKFLGLKMPPLRRIVRTYYKKIQSDALTSVLTSPVHEFRLAGLLVLVYQFQSLHTQRKKTGEQSVRTQQSDLIDLYCAHTTYINNRDLVDVTAPQTLGTFLIDETDRSILYRFAKSKLLRERRIAMVATQALIKQDQFKDTFALAEILLQDFHDLMHKAVGRMLREVGKRNLSALEDFLVLHYKSMPRTMLRYAIEKIPENKRLQYLHGKM